MTKTESFTTFLLGTASYLGMYAMFMITFSIFAPAHASTFAMSGASTNAAEARFETAAYATYTPQMAERGQRFYVGP